MAELPSMATGAVTHSHPRPDRGAVGSLRAHWPEYLMEGGLLESDEKLEYRQGFLVRDPDGHVIQFAEK